MKTLLPILCLIGLCFAVNNDKRTDAIDSIGIVSVVTADTAIGIRDYSRIRCIFADVGGIVKLQIRTRRNDTITVVRVLNDATFYPITNVIKVFPLYNGSDSTTCQVYDTSGVLIRGIGLGF